MSFFKYIIYRKQSLIRLSSALQQKSREKVGIKIWKKNSVKTGIICVKKSSESRVF